MPPRSGQGDKDTKAKESQLCPGKFTKVLKASFVVAVSQHGVRQRDVIYHSIESKLPTKDDVIKLYLYLMNDCDCD